VNLPVTSVPRCIDNKAKTLGLKNLYFPYMGSSGGSPDGERVVHNGKDEPFEQQDSIPVGQTAPPV
jgi:hypothetical protein